MMISKVKYFFFALVFLFSSLDARDYKSVFDCSSGDAQYIKSRMWLVGKTKEMVEEQGDKAIFAITLHGDCVAMVSENYDMIVPDEDMKYIKKAQDILRELATKKGVEVTVCTMSLVRSAIDKEDVLPFVKISKNSFLDTIAYQNDGYALMTFK